MSKNKQLDAQAMTGSTKKQSFGESQDFVGGIVKNDDELHRWLLDYMKDDASYRRMKDHMKNYDALSTSSHMFLDKLAELCRYYQVSVEPACPGMLDGQKSLSRVWVLTLPE